MGIPIDEWTEKYFGRFAEDIEATLSVMTDNSDHEVYQIRRLIMISLRDGRGHQEMIDYASSTRPR